MQSGAVAERSFLETLNSEPVSVSAELRPPKASASGRQSMDDWIDIYHSIRRLTQGGSHVFITDSAVGQHEEENLRHLVINLGPDARRSRIVPFLTCKHTLDYCLRYAARAFDQGFKTLVVLGGDRFDGIPRCVEHAYELRREIRKRVPGLQLGGWANPNGNAQEQVDFLTREPESTDFYLTQVVSHHDAEAVTRFLEELHRRKVELPGVFGVFYYRSANQNTLASLRRFFTVPVEGLRREFEVENLPAEAVCGRSISRLRQRGVRHVYISNFPATDAPLRFEKVKRAIVSGA
jgi:5,10-methylenetetrahydrofolate reductase